MVLFDKTAHHVVVHGAARERHLVVRGISRRVRTDNQTTIEHGRRPVAHDRLVLPGIPRHPVGQTADHIKAGGIRRRSGNIDFVAGGIAAAARSAANRESGDIGTILEEELVPLHVARADGITAQNRSARIRYAVHRQRIARDVPRIRRQTDRPARDCGIAQLRSRRAVHCYIVPRHIGSGCVRHNREQCASSCGQSDCDGKSQPTRLRFS